MRKLLLVLPALALAGALASPALAQCQACDGSMFCVGTANGAFLCYGDGLACSMALPCRSGGGDGRTFDGARLSPVTLVTVLDGDAPAARGGDDARVTPGDSRDVIGAEALAHARALARGAFTGRVLESGLLHGAGAGVGLADARSDGLWIRRDDQGGAVRVVLRAFDHGVPGRTLLDRMLVAGDVVTTHAMLGGAERLIVLQPLAVAGGDAGRLESLRAAVRATPRAPEAPRLALVPAGE